MDYFKEYVSNYDLNNERVVLKYNHSIRVREKQIKYATLLKWNDDDVRLAGLIDLLHDIGRFEQLKRYNTFSDRNSVDHASLGVEILFNEGFINKYNLTLEEKEIVKFAIYNHNKLKIEDCNDEGILKHAKLIRDTDKTDILYLVGYLDELHLRTTDDEVSSDVIECVLNKMPVDIKYVNNINDKIVVEMAFLYDLNYDIIKEDFKDNLRTFYKKVRTNDMLDKVYEKIEEDL